MSNHNHLAGQRARGGVRAVWLAAAPSLLLALVLLGVAPLVAHGKTAPFPIKLKSIAPACECESLRSMLLPEDVAAIEALPASVLATLKSLPADPANPPDPGAAAIAKLIATGTFDGDFDGVKAGAHACTVYWYGFLDQTMQRVGRHKCTVKRVVDSVSITKTTGDGLAGKLVRYLPGGLVFVGRSYLPDHKARAYDKAEPANPENTNFGNFVGFAVANKGHLYIISTDKRGFTEPDDTFFQVLAIE